MFWLRDTFDASKGDSMKPVLVIENNSAFELVYRVQKLLVRERNKKLATFTYEAMESQTYDDLLNAGKKYVNVPNIKNKRDNNYPFRYSDSELSSTSFDAPADIDAEDDEEDE